MARPTKLTGEVHDRIVAAVRAGNYPEPSARAAGIHPATYYRWMERGEKEKSGIYRDSMRTCGGPKQKRRSKSSLESARRFPITGAPGSTS